ncbi:MAG: ATP-binding cassette domain-containing protein [Elusimicrobia bacterium]|nr:ATP-binding cassette domain-containing protein [Elusimicrobiota bacterium]
MEIKINNIHYNVHGSGKQILNGIDISVSENNILTIVGPSGSGKSTFLKVAAGLIEPTSGEVIIENINFTKDSRKQIYEIREKMGFSFQDAALINNLNVYDNIALPLKYHTNLNEKEIFTKIYSWLERMELSKNIYDLPAELNISQKKVVGLIRTIINSPRYIFLDEPTNNMDYHYADLVRKVIKELKNENTAIMMTTNHIKWASEICNNIAVLIEGKLEMCGKYEDICSTENKKVKEVMRRIGGHNAN